jgi:hypothetical protein
MPSPRGHIAVVCLSAVALAVPAAALSDNGSPPPGTPSIDQYVETVPSSGGGWSEGTASTRSKPLRPAVTRHLRQQPDDQQLETVATSSKFGAPQQRLSRPANKNKQVRDSSSLGAAVQAVSTSGDSHIYWLLAAMIVVTTTMVWSAARLRRR